MEVKITVLDNLFVNSLIDFGKLWLCLNDFLPLMLTIEHLPRCLVLWTWVIEKLDIAIWCLNNILFVDDSVNSVAHWGTEVLVV